MPTADSWITTVTRHWYLDWEGPRAERDIMAAAEAIERDREAAHGSRRAQPDGAKADENDANRTVAPKSA